MALSPAPGPIDAGVPTVYVLTVCEDTGSTALLMFERFLLRPYQHRVTCGECGITFETTSSPDDFGREVARDTVPEETP